MDGLTDRQQTADWLSVSEQTSTVIAATPASDVLNENKTDGTSRHAFAMSRKRVCVVVIGDIGHSPRMQMHSLSLAQCGFDVDVVGYLASEPREEVCSNPDISLHAVSEAPDFHRLMPRIVAWGLRILWQTVSLLVCMVSLSSPDVILVQNPPSVPSLPVCWLVSRVRGAKFVIDWHNYGYTILRLQYSGEVTLAVKLYKYLETRFGSLADGHFCVTKALQRNLFEEFDIEAKVLYDRPSDKFDEISLRQKHQLFHKLSKKYPPFASESGTRFTEYAMGSPVWKSRRPALIVSSTSWSEDEDFSILLRALQLYDKREGPNLVCVITGKGPLKDFYTRLISEFKFERVQFVLPWLEPAVYPKLLASADIGVCLHTSSSGLDLPMKVVDMFGCCLPVCAYRYDCINELVIHCENGLLFKTSMELANHLTNLLSHFPEESKDLTKFRRNIIQSFRSNRWHNNWCKNALNVFKS